jgi:hypothetical protein
MESSERSLGEFKRELLTDASTDTFGVYERGGPLTLGIQIDH